MEPSTQDLVSQALRRARELFKRGNFAGARRLIETSGNEADALDRERLNAALAGYRIDRGALLVGGLTLAAALLVAAGTLFH